MSEGLDTERLTREQWSRLNLVWVGFFVLMGALNIYVAYNFPEPFWVKFKVFGLMGITVVFLLAQSFWIFSKLDLSDENSKQEAE